MAVFTTFWDSPSRGCRQLVPIRSMGLAQRWRSLLAGTLSCHLLPTVVGRLAQKVWVPGDPSGVLWFHSGPLFARRWLSQFQCPSRCFGKCAVSFLSEFLYSSALYQCPVSNGLLQGWVTSSRGRRKRGVCPWVGWCRWSCSRLPWVLAFLCVSLSLSLPSFLPPGQSWQSEPGPRPPSPFLSLSLSLSLALSLSLSLSLALYIYIYTYTHLHVYIYICIYTYGCKYVSKYVCMYVCIQYT